MAKWNREAEEALVEFRWAVPREPFRVETVSSPGAFVTDGGHGKQARKRRGGAPGQGPKGSRRNQGERALLWPVAVGERCETRSYCPLLFNPLDEAEGDPSTRTKLFLRFLAHDGSEESIARFASTCGSLTAGDILWIHSSNRAQSGERVRLWRDEILDMRLAFALWCAVGETDDAALKEHVQFASSKAGLSATIRRECSVREGCDRKTFSVLDPRDATAPRAEWLKDGDYRLAATFAVQDLVRQRLRQWVQPTMVFDPAFEDATATALRPRRAARLPLGLRLIPRNLLGALWLQLAQAIECGTEYRKCAGCSKRMEISLEVHRSSRRTCSGRCREAVRRGRADEARVRRAGGAPLRSIAKTMGASLAQVREWTKKPKRPRGRPRK